MRKGFISIFLVVLLLLTPAWAATDIQFTLVRNYLIVVSVTINGTGPYEFLLDTGTNTTLLHTEFAAQLGLRPMDRVELITVAGSQAVPRAKLPSLRLGDKVENDLEVLFSDLRGVRSVLPKVRGVLGQNFLAEFNYLVDYPNRRISFVNEAEARWCGVQLPFALHEGKMLVTVEPGWRLLLDSAIAELLVFDTAARRGQLDLEPNSLHTMQLKSGLGSQGVWQGNLRTFRLGEILLRNLPVTLLNQNPAEVGRVENGLLPMSAFQSIYVNHRQNHVLLNPIPPANQ